MDSISPPILEGASEPRTLEQWSERRIVRAAHQRPVYPCVSCGVRRQTLICYLWPEGYYCPSCAAARGGPKARRPQPLRPPAKPLPWPGGDKCPYIVPIDMGFHLRSGLVAGPTKYYRCDLCERANLFGARYAQHGGHWIICPECYSYFVVARRCGAGAGP